MDLTNSLRLFVGRTRWLKKRIGARTEATYLPLPRGHRLFVDARDLRGPSFNVMYGGSKAFDLYEKAEKDEILNHLPENGVFLDIGANIGLFAFYVHWLRPSATIHAFEPHPRNFGCLQQTCHTNAITAVVPHSLAIGDQPGELDLYFDESDSGGHSMYRETLENNRARTQSARVPVITLDEFSRRYALSRVDVIKIDTQGGEAAAIRGGREMLSRFKPALLIECDYRSLLEAKEHDSLIEALRATGVDYRARHVEGLSTALTLEQLLSQARIEVEQGRLQGNYLFTSG